MSWLYRSCARRKVSVLTHTHTYTLVELDVLVEFVHLQRAHAAVREAPLLLARAAARYLLRLAHRVLVGLVEDLVEVPRVVDSAFGVIFLGQQLLEFFAYHVKKIINSNDNANSNVVVMVIIMELVMVNKFI